MNERIKELEDQCWVQVPCDFDMRKGGLSTINTVFNRKKFAELLIRECMHLCVLEQADPRDTVEMGCALRIKKHFGVDYE